jgi:hypothetical protein
MEQFRSVSLEQVREVAAHLASSQKSLVAVGEESLFKLSDW